MKILVRGAVFAILCGCSGCSIIAGRVCGLVTAGSYWGVEVCSHRINDFPDACGSGGFVSSLLYLPVAGYWACEFPFVFVVDTACYPVDMAWAIAFHGIDGTHGWADIEWRPPPSGFHHPRKQLERYFWSRYASRRILDAIHDERPIVLKDVRLADENHGFAAYNANRAEFVRRQDALYLKVVLTSEKVRRMLEDGAYPVDEVTVILQDIRAFEQECASLEIGHSEARKVSGGSRSRSFRYSDLIDDFDRQFEDIKEGCRIMREVLDYLSYEQERKALKARR